MTRNFLRDTLLPLLVFPTLSYYAFQCTIGRLLASGLATEISSRCSSPNISPYALPYTGLQSLDQKLCGVIVFFHEAMSPGDPLTFLWYFIAVGSVFATVPAVESYRTNRSIFVALPVLFGLLSQVLTIGATTPLYWLIFFLSGGRSRFNNAMPVTKAHVEAIIFGLLIGAAVPSICMLVMQDPTVTAIWQPYPIYMSLATLLHLAIRRPNYAQSGFSTLQQFHLAAFMLASSAYFAVIWPRLDDLEAIKALLVPSFAPLSNAGPSLHIMDFLKWDLTFGLLSMGIAQLWFVSDSIEIPFILFWYFIAVPFFGPGAAVIAVSLWREGQIGDRLAIAKEKES